MSHSQHGIFFFFFFGHGSEGNIIYGKNWEPVNLNEIYRLLGRTRFKTFAGKPKVVIIQACRNGILKYNITIIFMNKYTRNIVVLLLDYAK